MGNVTWTRLAAKSSSQPSNPDAPLPPSCAAAARLRWSLTRQPCLTWSGPSAPLSGWPSNERLQAETLAHLDQLRASRVRIVETGDAERRQLERDLHDGAQQRLLALSYDLRLARAQAQSDDDASSTTSLLTEATGEAQAALSELRTLAHGIYPAILGEAGLAPAVYSLADTTAIPVEIRSMAEGRYPTAVETAAYILVAEGLDNAARRDASHVTVDIVQDGGWLMVMVEDDGSDRTSDLIQLADRVGALDGRLVVESTRLRAALRCA
jgi:signal transduction histidine kinase